MGWRRVLRRNAYSIRLIEVFLCLVGHPGGPGHGVTRLHGLTQEILAGKIKSMFTFNIGSQKDPLWEPIELQMISLN